MSDSIFHIFSDERFLDLTVYQYGYEKCEPLHSYGPFVRNHYLFHYIISGKGMLSVTEKDDNAVYHMEAHSGFLIEPGRINLYSADQKFPWEYVWVEFDGLRAKELMEEGSLKLKAIVEQAGFLSYPYFFNLFKKKYNMTPNEYMNVWGRKMS